ncbi:MAG: hypothetical protein LBI71_05955 [Enterobacteriaceae bacterium]|jgi:hypothetical protein|nr:hypothetical protein [Enterobacteriaceae bacterium]
MIYRSKSFNLHRPLESSGLTRANSFSGKWSKSFNIRASIVIKEVSALSAHRAVEKILNETMDDDWNDIEYSTLNNETRKWHDRFCQTKDILSNILSVSEGLSMESPTELSMDRSRELFFVAYFRSVPVGALYLLVTNNGRIPEVVYVATHCGIRNCGPLLIESAVNKSQQFGTGGKLKLFPLEKARYAYLKMGFSNLNLMMQLVPSEHPDKWIWNTNTQRYKYNFI